MTKAFKKLRKLIRWTSPKWGIQVVYPKDENEPASVLIILKWGWHFGHIAIAVPPRPDNTEGMNSIAWGAPGARTSYLVDSSKEKVVIPAFMPEADITYYNQET